MGACLRRDWPRRTPFQTKHPYHRLASLNFESRTQKQVPRLTFNFDPTFNFVGTTSSELFNRRSNIVGVIQSLVHKVQCQVQSQLALTHIFETKLLRCNFKKLRQKFNLGKALTLLYLPMSPSEDIGTPSTGGHFRDRWLLGDMSDRWSVFQHKHTK